jgi:hypothetical protein
MQELVHCAAHSLARYSWQLFPFFEVRQVCMPCCASFASNAETLASVSKISEPNDASIAAPICLLSGTGVIRLLVSASPSRYANEMLKLISKSISKQATL